jgi:hypothetical protein
MKENTLYTYIYLYICLSYRLNTKYSYNVRTQSVYRIWQ